MSHATMYMSARDDLLGTCCLCANTIASNSSVYFAYDSKFCSERCRDKIVAQGLQFFALKQQAEKVTRSMSGTVQFEQTPPTAEAM